MELNRQIKYMYAEGFHPRQTGRKYSIRWHFLFILLKDVAAVSYLLRSILQETFITFESRKHFLLIIYNL